MYTRSRHQETDKACVEVRDTTSGLSKRAGSRRRTHADFAGSLEVTRQRSQLREMQDEFFTDSGRIVMRKA